MLFREILFGECTGHPNDRKYSDVTFVLLLDLDCPIRELPSSSFEEDTWDFNLLFTFLPSAPDRFETTSYLFLPLSQLQSSLYRCDSRLYRLVSVLLGSCCSCPLASEWHLALCSLSRVSRLTCWGSLGLRTLSEKASDKLERLCWTLMFSIFSLMALMCSLIWRWLRRLSTMASDSSSLAEWFFMLIWRRDWTSLGMGSMWLRLRCAGRDCPGERQWLAWQ